MAKSQTAVDKLMAQLQEAVTAGNVEAATNIGKQLVKAKAESDKANAEQYAAAKAECASWLAEKIADVVTEANAQFEIGCTIQQLKWTAAGTIGSDGKAQNNNSCAINPKRGGGSGTGTGGGGQRGNVLGTGLTMAEIVEQHGTDEEQASYAATDDKNARYALVRKIVKRMND